MSSTDPRILIPIIEELCEGLRRSSLEQMQVVEDATAAQRSLEEHTTRMDLRISLLQKQTDSDLRIARDSLDNVERSQARTEDLSARCDHTLSDCLRIEEHSNRVRNHWRGEVARAEARVKSAASWVSNAEARVSRAESNVRSAEADLMQAQNQRASATEQVGRCESRLSYARGSLDSARSALAHCQQPVQRTDSQGRQYVEHRDCSGCYAAVSNAEYAVAQASNDLSAAQSDLRAARERESIAEHQLSMARNELMSARAELTSAQAELQAARKDLYDCQVSLEKAIKAVASALAARERADFAKHTSAKAFDAVSAARAPAERALDLNTLQLRLCERLLQTLKSSQTLIDASQFELNKAAISVDKAVDSAMGGGNAMSIRMDDLRDLDRLGNFN